MRRSSESPVTLVFVARPRVDDADRRDIHIRVLTTKAEHKELQEAAAAAAMSISAWLRDLALKRARAMARNKRVSRTKAVEKRSM